MKYKTFLGAVIKEVGIGVEITSSDSNNDTNDHDTATILILHEELDEVIDALQKIKASVE